MVSTGMFNLMMSYNKIQYLYLKIRAMGLAISYRKTSISDAEKGYSF